MVKIPSAGSDHVGPRDGGPSGQTPENCRQAYVAGAVRQSPTRNAPGVLWTCRLRDRTAAPLFTREECYECRRWSRRQGPVSEAWACEADHAPLPSAGPIGRVSYRRGAPIIQEGAPADVLYTILRGTVKLLKTTASGRSIGIDISPPGSPLEAAWLFLGTPFAASAVALEVTTCVAMPRRIVMRLIDAYPRLLRELVSEISDHELNLMDRIAETAGASVEARFAHLFLKLAGKIGIREHGRIFVRIPLLRHDLADLTGTTVETSIRVMSRWNKQRIVTTRDGGFVIHDRSALERLRG